MFDANKIYPLLSDVNVLKFLLKKVCLIIHRRANFLAFSNSEIACLYINIYTHREKKYRNFLVRNPGIGMMHRLMQEVF